MILSIFSIFDSAVQAWSRPMYARSKGEMLRQFEAAVQDVNTDFAKHPSDYVLFELGTFEDTDCTFSLLASPIRLAIANQFVKSAVPEVATPAIPSSGA